MLCINVKNKSLMLIVNVLTIKLIINSDLVLYKIFFNKKAVPKIETAFKIYYNG